MEKPIKGREYTDANGIIWTCVNVTNDLFTMERRYTEPGESGFCQPYDVVEREPLPLAWFAGRYTEVT